MNNKLAQILSDLHELLPYVKAEYHVNSLEVFGSYVRNEQKHKSDLDLLVTFTTTPSLFKFIELENYLSDNLDIKVDLVMKESLKAGISPNVLSEAIQI